LKQSKDILNAPELESLINADIDLISLWQSFEKDCLDAIDKIKEGSIKAARFPSVFGLPDAVYYYNGIILCRTFKRDVRCLINIDLEKEL